jgi:hypothetical protein
MEPLRPGQCLLITNGGIFTVSKGKLWLDRVYIRFRQSHETRQSSLVSAGSPGQLWMSGVTIQGDGVRLCEGLYVDSSAYIEGAHSRRSIRIQIDSVGAKVN